MRRISQPMQYASFALLLFGLKLWIIGTYGNATPFWDQWEAEGSNLYVPYFNHTLAWWHFFGLHNEHRIFTTRVLALFLLKVNGVWNPLLQMVVNAILHIIAIMLGIFMVKRVVGPNNLPALLGFSLILFGIPTGWENTLAGFQSCYYFVILFSLLSLWLLIVKEPMGGGWWAGIGCGVLAFLSLASGVFPFAAASLVSLLIFVTGVRRTKKQAIATVIVIGLFIIGFWLTPNLPGSGLIKAHSFRQFYDSMILILGWPVARNLLGALLVNLPILIFCIKILKTRPPANDRKWFLFGIAVWAISQVTSIAYGRTSFTMFSRYFDLYDMFLFVNFACLLSIAQEYSPIKWKNWAVIGIFGWTAIVLISLGTFAVHNLPGVLSWKKGVSQVEETATRNYVTTHNRAYLTCKPGFMDIPYPDSDALAKIIEMPGIREILPPNLNPPVPVQLEGIGIQVQPADAFISNGYYYTTPKWNGNTWGSYTNKLGDHSLGEMTWKFTTNLPDRELAIPVAGYPLRDGIKLQIIQNGRSRTIPIDQDPHETWGMAYTRVDKGDFSLHLTDASNTTWLAVAAPTLIGRRYSMTDQVLSGYWMFLLLGCIILLFVFINENYKV